MASNGEITIGDDVALSVTLKQKVAGSTMLTTFTVDPAATVVAQFISMDRKTKYGPQVTCLESETGADWANSLIIVPMTAAESAQIAYTGMARIAVGVTENGKKRTYTGEVEILPQVFT